MRSVQGLKVIPLAVLIAGFGAPASMSFNHSGESIPQYGKLAAPSSRSLLRAPRDDSRLLGYLRTSASAPRSQPRIRAERSARALTTAERAIVQIARFFSSDGKLTYRESGSGVVVHPNGTILTNVHVIRSTGQQGCTISIADPPRADLLVILIQDPKKPTEPPTPKFAVDLRGLRGEALARALPTEDLSLDLAVLRINKRIAGEAPPKNLNELIQAVEANTLVLEDLSESPDLDTLALWDTAAIEVGQDIQLGGYPVVSPLPRLTFTEGPVLEKRADGTMILNRAFATYGFSGGALIEKRSGFVVGVLCGGQSIETPAGSLVLAVGRALDARVQQLFNKVPEVKRRPVPRFVFTPEFPEPEGIITLDASNSFDPDGEIAKYEWDLNGDGKSDTTGERIELALLKDERVSLIVTDHDGLSAQRTQRVILDRREQLRQQQQHCKPIQIGNQGFDTIEEAINAAQPGETITVGPGTCQENLVITKSLRLQGAGREKTVLLGDGRKPVIKIEVPPGKPQIVVTIEGFTIRNGLHALQALGNVKVALWESDLLESVQQGVDAAFGADITLTNNRISENDEEGLVLEGGKAELQGNTIANNKDKGVVIKSLRTHGHFTPADAALEGNKIEMNGGFGVLVTQQARVEIQGGQISRNKSAGLEANEQAVLTKIIGTEILKNAEAGIHMFDAAAEMIEKTMIFGNEGGISLGGSARASSRNSQISGNGGEGVILRDLSELKGLRDSIVKDNNTGIFMVDTTRAELSNVQILSNKYGILAAFSAQITITNSKIFDNEELGIFIIVGAHATIAGSDIANNGSGIVIGIGLGESPQATIIKSRITNNRGDGIVMGSILEKDSPQVTISDSEISDNEDNGIFIRSMAKLELQDSTIKDQRADASTGIFMEGSAQAILSNAHISGNMFGILMVNSTLATITGSQTQISRNKVGIVAKDLAQISVTNSVISSNRYDGILMLDSAKLDASNNRIFNSRRYGVALFQRPCFNTDEKFKGEIKGISNEIYDNKTNLCPRPGEYPWPPGFGGGA